MSEIIISNSGLNEDPYRDFSYRIQEENFRHSLFGQLMHERVTPITHPKAVDLCAGDGCLARILVDNGWKEANLTCIDRYKSPTPLVPDARWFYWDLEQLYLHLERRLSLPEEVLSFRHQFDIAMLWLGGFGLGESGRELLCKYFVKPKGYILHI